MKLIKLIILFSLALVFANCTQQEAVSEWYPVLSETLSNQHVTAIAEDGQGFIWVGTERGLNRYDSKQYRQYFMDSGLSSNGIVSLFKDSRNRLWVGTDKGLCLYNARKDRFDRFKSDVTGGVVHQIWETPDGRVLINMIERLCEVDSLAMKVSVVIPDFDPDAAFINECYPDAEGNFWSVTNSHLTLYGNRTLTPLYHQALQMNCSFSKLTADGTLWLDTTEGIRCFDTQSRQFVPLPHALEMDKLFCRAKLNHILELWKGVLCIFTDKGAWLYTSEEDIIYYSPEVPFPQGIGIDEISCLFRDSRGDLWLGSRYQGIANTHFWNNTPFNSDSQLISLTEGIPVTSLALDREGTLWITGADDTLLQLDANHETHRFSLAEKLGKSGKWDSAPRIFTDTSGRIWLIHKAKLYQIKEGRFIYHPELDKEASCMAEDKDGTLWVGSGNSDRLWRLQAGEHKFETLILDIPKLSRVSTLLPTDDGQLILGMTLANPIVYNPQERILTRIPLWEKATEMDVIESLAYDTEGRIWMGTRRSGAWVYQTESKQLWRKEGLSCEEISAILCLQNGDIWVSTLFGLNYIKGGTELPVHYYAAEGTGGDQFHAHASLELPDGRLVFGGNHGLTIVNPEVKFTFYQAPLYFEDLVINGNYVTPGEKMDAPLSYCPSLRLGHRDNQISISYNQLEFSGYHPPQYSYRLKGYQNEWLDNGNRTEVFFSNLPPGRYRLEVRTNPTDEKQETVSAMLNIRVKPAPWNAWWAWTLYFLAALGLLSYLYLMRISNLRQAEAAKRAELEKVQEKKVNEMNMSFFANISHEFRTPLTLISGPVVQMEKGETTPAMLSTLKWNVARMLRLVNQLMDFSKLEGDTLHLKVYPQNVVALLRAIVGSFSYNMEQKSIKFQPSGLEEEFTCLLDEDKLDKIVSNLLSNAMKYTPKGGTVGCSFDVFPSDGGKVMQIKVWNSGPAIPEKDLEHIFERFFQVENHQNYGTGIGLYFARRLAELHHGSLSCENMEGIGPAFILTLPAEDIYNLEEKAEVAPQARAAIFTPSEGALEEQTQHQEHGKTLLVVDDDPGIVRFLEDVFADSYNVRFAYDGNTALESVRSETPDLIVSDVAMPNMDGYELCRQIKEDRELCHIPVILVTAKTTAQNQIEGLHRGADAYVTKPFDPNVLKAMVESQLSNRERMKALFGEKTQVEEVQKEAPLAPQDSKLMKDFYALMEEHLSNDMLNIDQFADKLHISRSKFYYKIKALTGDSPSAFFKTYKLNRAKEMLRSGVYRISEVADLTGFSTPSVFGRNFKAQFGMTPTEFLESDKD